MTERNSPHQRKYLPTITIEHLWVALPLVLVVAMGFRHKLRLLDFWWHLKIGEIIVETGSIPRTDIFSFTAEGTTFVLQNWLTETFYYLIYRLGGLELLIVANTIVLLGALIPIYHLCWDSLRRARPTAVAVGFAVLALAGVYSNVRPQTVSFLFFSVFYWVLLRYVKGGNSPLWILPLLTVLWVNLHGAFVLGLGLILLISLAELTRTMAFGEQPETMPYQKLIRLFIVFLVSCLTSLINPETSGVYDYVLTVLRDPGSQVYVSEWQPPNIKTFSGLVCFYGPFFISLPIIFYSRRKLNLTELILFLGFAAFGLSSLRNGIWFSLVLSPILASQLAATKLSDGLNRSRLQRFWASRVSGASVDRKAVPTVNLAVALLMLLGCVVSAPWIQPLLTHQPLWEEDTPVGAIDYIESQQLRGNIFHSQAYGDYLIWRLWPHQKTFLDGRVHLFGGDLVEKYSSIFRDRCWEYWLAPYDIQYLFLRVSSKSERTLMEKALDSSNWQLLYEDHLSVLLVRTSLRSGELPMPDGPVS